MMQWSTHRKSAAALAVSALSLGLTLFVLTGNKPSPPSSSPSRPLHRWSPRNLWDQNVYWAGNPAATPPPPQANKHPPQANKHPPPPSPSYRNDNYRPPGNPFEKGPISTSSSKNNDSNNNSDSQPSPAKQPSPSSPSNNNDSAEYVAGRPSAAEQIVSATIQGGGSSSKNTQPQPSYVDNEGEDWGSSRLPETQNSLAYLMIPQTSSVVQVVEEDYPIKLTMNGVKSGYQLTNQARDMTMNFVENTIETYLKLEVVDIELVRGGRRKSRRLDETLSIPLKVTVKGDPKVSDLLGVLQYHSSDLLAELREEDYDTFKSAEVITGTHTMSEISDEGTNEEDAIIPQFEGDASKRFCGFSWSDVIQNCLTRVPCAQGYADGVCPDGMGCLADTPCTDETWLDYLSSLQPSNTNENDMQANSSPAVTFSCSTDGDCPYGQFCTGTTTTPGECVDCLPSGKGCPTSQFCSTTFDGTWQCHDRPTAPATASSQLQQDQVMQKSPPKPVTMYENPPDNNFFCGVTFSAITDTCLKSKPCPTGIASNHCNEREGCFAHPTCQTQYAAASYVVNNYASSPSMISFVGLDITQIYPEEEIETEKSNLRASTTPETAYQWNTVGTVGLLNHASTRWSMLGLVCSLFTAIGLSVI